MVLSERLSMRATIADLGGDSMLARDVSSAGAGAAPARAHLVIGVPRASRRLLNTEAACRVGSVALT